MDFVREHLDFEFRELEYGPGFQIPYFEGQEQADEEILLQEFKKALDSLNFKGINLSRGRPFPGRSLRQLSDPRGGRETKPGTELLHCGRRH